MITLEAIEELTTKSQVPRINIAREYLQHLFLSCFYKLKGAENVLFKGGMALRIVYGSPRFSEDLDFSSFNVEPRAFKGFIENRFQDTLASIEQAGIEVELGSKPGPTSGGYRGDAAFTLHDLQVDVSIDVSCRDGRRTAGEVVAVTNNYIPTYNLFQFPKKLLVEEKIDALFAREKPRDFYDLYFMLRKGLVGAEQKERLVRAKDLIEKTRIDFKAELEALLPRDQHQIIGQLKARLSDELDRQLSERQL